jgi:hypothetical protein
VAGPGATKPGRLGHAGCLSCRRRFPRHEGPARK